MKYYLFLLPKNYTTDHSCVKIQQEPFRVVSSIVEIVYWTGIPSVYLSKTTELSLNWILKKSLEGNWLPIESRSHPLFEGRPAGPGSGDKGWRWSDDRTTNYIQQINTEFMT